MVAAVTAVTGVAAAASAGGGRPSVGGAADVPATSPPTTATTLVDAPPPLSTPESPSASTSTTPTLARAPAPTTTTTVSCRNSTDPRCGPFRWDPDPGPNAPFDVSVSFTPAHPHVGEQVTFFVRAVDPDAKWVWGVARDFGDPGGAVAIDGSSMIADAYPDYCAPAKYGPWTPPPRRSSDETFGYPERGVTHKYTAPGTYKARWSLRSDSTACGLHEPYGSFGSESVTVDVQPAETTTSTTST
ncbi:MAG TPA: hypothetical protein VG076_08325 [Acidimicrobiales bacterium]|nr:hypothetical protein [Acidimicrobiales bacterium]